MAARASTQGLPVLWQLEISHYNEKVRWALDHKRISHVRRSLLPGLHAVKARRLTGDVDTTPVLTLGDRSIGDSSRIIAVLEQRWRSLPCIRRSLRRGSVLSSWKSSSTMSSAHTSVAVYQELLSYPELVVPLFTHGQRLPGRMLVRGTFPLLRVLMRRALDINAAAAEESRQRTVGAMDRLEREIGASGYLVGDCFTVADLTAAALFYPVVQPPEFPYPSVIDPPGPAREYLETLSQRPGGKWVAEMYRRHRLVDAVPARSR